MPILRIRNFMTIVAAYVNAAVCVKANNFTLIHITSVQGEPVLTPLTRSDELEDETL